MPDFKERMKNSGILFLQSGSISFWTYFSYPVFDAERKSIFSIKSPSPQYQPKKKLIPNQTVEQPTKKTSNDLMDKGIDMLRRTSITLANAYNKFTNSLQRYSWISDVDNLVSGC